jgi:hypothetical protein
MVSWREDGPGTSQLRFSNIKHDGHGYQMVMTWLWDINVMVIKLNGYDMVKPWL